MHPDVVCGLDIGASSVRALIAQPQDRRIRKKKDAALHASEKILGFAEAHTRGFSKGVVSNLSLLSDAIEVAVSKAEDAARCKVRKVIANISGMHIRTFKSRGSIHISDRPSEITERDLKRCIASAKLIAMSLDREVIHLVSERFYIDDKMEISEPLGLFGSKLDVDLNIITSLVSVLQNLTKAVNMAGYEVEDLITSGSGTALAIFESSELDEGAMIVDIGKDHTEASLFMNQKLRDCFCFPFGSNDLTIALQDKLKIMFEEAEELRIRYGVIAKDSQVLFDDTEVSIPLLKHWPGSGEEDTQSDRNRSGGSWVDSEQNNAGARSGTSRRANVISRREISNLLFPKVEEIMQEVYKKIEPFLRQREHLPHIHILGGPSRMDGFIEAVEDIFRVPVSMARIRSARDLRDTNFACALGLARYGIAERLKKCSGYVSGVNSLAGRLVSRIRSLFADYF